MLTAETNRPQIPNDPFISHLYKDFSSYSGTQIPLIVYLVLPSMAAFLNLSSLEK